MGCIPRLVSKCSTKEKSLLSRHTLTRESCSFDQSASLCHRLICRLRTANLIGIHIRLDIDLPVMSRLLLTQPRSFLIMTAAPLGISLRLQVRATMIRPRQARPQPSRCSRLRSNPRFRSQGSYVESQDPTVAATAQCADLAASLTEPSQLRARRTGEP